METITDVTLADIQAEVHGSKAKRELTDKLDDLPGVIMARVAANKIDFYYKYRWEKKRELLHLGIYSPRVRKDRVTLPQAFDNAVKHAEIRWQGENPKEPERRVYFEIANMKKKRGGKEIAHIVPLNKLALTEINAMREITGHCEFPFAGRIGSGVRINAPLAYDGMQKSMKVLCKAAKLRHMTLGESRTTIKTLLGPHPIEKHIKNILHSHGSMDVADTNYDKFDYFHQKREALDIWNDLLEKILEEHKPVGRR